ncbi:cysteine peptidase family C39 domain-containing protein [Archangium gephyra]|uniref:cysteine peptidase family C39 domain-containing protein n=1 Tax=Archangium gephyra TaxID=48 RepID=UPI003B7B5BB3
MAGTPRLFIPEVIQTSAMDCGPAALKSLLGGFGVPVSYGRLRESCQTDVDGTSIDTLEELAVTLGLDAEQSMLPRDQLLLEETQALPALVVVSLGNGNLHFVVLWKRWGHLVQVMDPALGRRWVSVNELLDQLFVHAMPVSAEAFREWAGTEEFLAGLRSRVSSLVGGPVSERLVSEALGDSSWKSLACLDAAARLVRTLVDGDGLRRGDTVAGFLEQLLREVRSALEEGRAEEVIPSSYWTAVGKPDAGQLILRGAVCVKARGLRGERGEDEPPLSPEARGRLARGSHPPPA